MTMNIVGLDSAEFIQVLKHQRLVVDYTFVTAAALFIYDHILTLHLEIKLIWFSPWSYTKVLFLLVRYTGFVTIFPLTFQQTFPDHSKSACKILIPTTGWLLHALLSFSDVVLAVRTWAVWDMNKKIGVGLTVLVLIDTIRFPLLNRFFASLEFAPLPYPGFRGCFLITASRNLWAVYVLSIVVQSNFLALVVISAFRSYRSLNTNKLWHIIHRDGIMFYVYILAFTTLNLVMALSLPIDMLLTFSAIQEMLYSLLTARIVLSIRGASRHLGVPSELHTSYYDNSTSPIPLRFLHTDEEHSREHE